MSESELTDSRRLEFLVSNRHLRLHGSDAAGWWITDVSEGLEVRVKDAPTFRAAIDAVAMAEGGEQ